MSHRRIARVVLGQIESLESRRMLDSGDAWLNGSWTGPGIVSAGTGYAENNGVLTFNGIPVDAHFFGQRRRPERSPASLHALRRR